MRKEEAKEGIEGFVPWRVYTWKKGKWEKQDINAGNFWISLETMLFHTIADMLRFL